MDEAKKRTDMARQDLIDDLEQAVATLRDNAERIRGLEKRWAESEWYLGEAKAKIMQFDNDLQEKEYYLRRMEDGRQALQKAYDECKWYLEEEKEKRRQLEIVLANLQGRCQDLEAQVGQLKKQLP